VPLALALASLRRHGARTLLAVLGVTVAAALLLDMVMLSTGLRESFRALLEGRGYQLRLAPRGTLPFDTEATISGANEILIALRADRDVERASPVLGATVHLRGVDGVATGFALGVQPEVQGDYELLEGAHPGLDEIVVNDALLLAAGARVGDTIAVATGYDPQLRAFAGERRLRISGRTRFLYLAVGQRASALRLETLQSMAGRGDDRVSLFMVRIIPGGDPEAVGARIAEQFPRVEPVSTARALATVDQRLSYFRQLSYILGGVSLAVGFLLVTTIVTVSVNERVGEIAVMRAVGISRHSIVKQVAVETAALVLAGTLLGTLLGLVTARWLNEILGRFPGLPAAIDFFLFTPRAVVVTILLLVLSGVAAAIYPAWRAASLPIAGTLREEAVA
jgi:putative ABC transport system permease protein